jgi:hypothetical protein
VAKAHPAPRGGASDDRSTRPYSPQQAALSFTAARAAIDLRAKPAVIPAGYYRVADIATKLGLRPSAVWAIIRRAKAAGIKLDSIDINSPVSYTVYRLDDITS